MSWTVIASNAASATENRPVYIFFVIFRSIGGKAKTHEEKHPYGMFLPTFYPLLVLFLGPIEIHRE
jgi:hypothetical protein